MALFLVTLCCAVSTAAHPITITPGSDRHEWRHLSPSPLPHGAPNIPQWSTIYDFDVETNGTGTTDFTNLLWDANLTALGAACARFPTNKAMWSPVASCDPNKTKVYGEPYCGGPTGLWMGPGGKEWQVGADSWVGKRRYFLVFCATIREIRDFNREKYGTNRESVTLQRQSRTNTGSLGCGWETNLKSWACRTPRCAS
eukprot:SAG31_NODE_127_length_23612_cov_39.709863_8_plen_199_part_00